MKHLDLTNKTVVITGGAGVLCSEFSRAVSACGAKTAILGLHVEKAARLAARIQAEGGIARGFAVDVTDKDSVIAAHRAVTEAFGPCDILINGAGGNQPGATCDDEFFSRELYGKEGHRSFFDLEPEGISSVFGLNMMGTLLPTQVFARDFIDRPGGVIVNISSMNAFTPLTKIPAYSAAKAAVSNFTRWLAVHFAKSGVRVNAIAPGFFSSEQNKTLLWQPDGTPTPRANKILTHTPLGRFGEAKELVGTLLWLIDNDAASFVTGIVVPVDGGFSAYAGV
ncbi:MAG: SDR family oxidoreductase [Eubacteriales bacterium]